ncbi:MAG: PHP domain-containing protein [Elusimicrobia bacterium]|jgi:predicted metal-dependent phosphoesterase TrpH|nr:PHP domain-containing protein [Elusimicrobiota bacterium]
MKIDMHAHTSRYSLCSRLSPEDLIKTTREAGLEAVVITEHDKYWPEKELARFREKFDDKVKIFTGQEVSTAAGHVLVFGCANSFKYNIKVEDLADEVRQRGGVSFLSHPYRYADISYFRENRDEAERCYKYFDGIEVLNGNQSCEQNKFALAEYRRMNITGIAGSDAHSAEMAGRFMTEFKCDIENEKELVEALKEGLCRPCENKFVKKGEN